MLALPLAGCGDDADDGVQIVATTGIVADVTEQLTGPNVDVEQLIPDSASPHDFQLSAQDRASLDDAELVVASGAGLEAGIPLDEVDSDVWELAAHVGELRPFDGSGEHGGEEDEHTSEHDADPHVWMDPRLVSDALPALAAALGDADPANAARYERRARAYAAELRRLDRELTERLGDIPRADRKLVTSHDSLGYFAARYGFEVVATAFPASGPEAEVSAARLNDVEEAVRASGVPAVFAQQDDDPAALRAVAAETGVAIEEGLLVESPADTGSYLEMLRRDAAMISRALG